MINQSQRRVRNIPPESGKKKIEKPPEIGISKIGLVCSFCLSQHFIRSLLIDKIGERYCQK